MRVYLSGPMGAGKSTLARLLGARLDREVVDIDARIEARAGISIEAIFAASGEASFRKLEREEAEALMASPGDEIVALGGGAVLDRALRHALLDDGLVITLLASPEELARRLGRGEGRPLLAGGDLRARLGRLLEQRADAYAECHATLRSDALDPEAALERIAALLESPPIAMPLGQRTYGVHVQAGGRAAIAAPMREDAGRVCLVVTDENVRRPWGLEACERLRSAGLVPIEIVLEPGEEHKHLRSVERIWDAGLEGGIDRGGWILGVGGGVVGDLAAFAASTLLRGVRLAQLPTSLLAMVDSSVGGKTGFNRERGKNLVGTFYQPQRVICDVEVLETLPLRERRAGMAEIVKSAWLDSEQAVAALERDAAALHAGEREATERAIRRSIALKARVVRDDELEAGGRMALNLGHTVGHALEARGAYRQLRHGEAVALGMVAAFRVASALAGFDRPSQERLERLERLLHALGLPADLDAHLDDEALSFLSADKKRAGGSIHFVRPGAPGRTRVQLIDEASLRAALAPR